MIYFDRDIRYNVYPCAHEQYYIHVLGILYNVRRTELIIYVHRLHVCYRFNYCYYIVINYHSVGSLRAAEADGRFTSLHNDPDASIM